MSNIIRNAVFESLKVKSFGFRTPVGSFGTYYIAGYYDAPTADANLNQAGATQAYGDANHAHAAHAFIVAGGAGTVAAGAGNQVGIKVTGTSITDNGTRTATDEEVITDDITSLAVDRYYETAKKWIGAISFELYIVGGAPATYSLDFNYGLCKYEDLNNTNFQIRGLECVGRAGNNDTGFNITLMYHKATGWTYSAAAFSTGSSDTICDMNTDYVTEKNLGSGQYFAYKRSNLATRINGADSEGIIIKVTTSANNAVEQMQAHLIYK